MFQSQDSLAESFLEQYNFSTLNHSIVHLIQEKLHNITYEDSTFSTSCEDCDSWVIENVTSLYTKTHHAIVAIIICIFGIIFNIFNVTILSHKDMAGVPINRILRGLAISDMTLMIEYMYFTWYYCIELPGKMNFPYWGAVFVLLHTHFTQVLHTVSVCFTVTLAVWRYIVIGYPGKNRILCSDRRCTIAISFCYILPILLCSPSFFMIKVRATSIIEDKEYILYHTALSDTAVNNPTYLILNFWVYAVLIKLFPCLILTIISIWLVRTLFKTKVRKHILKNYDYCLAFNRDKGKVSKKTDKTTTMLIAVVVLFLITEFPQGILGLLVGIKGRCFFLKCYQEFGEVFDILALINGSVSFILYCCMNKMFRDRFKRLFVGKTIMKLPTVTYVVAENHSTTTGTTTE